MKKNKAKREKQVNTKCVEAFGIIALLQYKMVRLCRFMGHSIVGARNKTSNRMVYRHRLTKLLAQRRNIGPKRQSIQPKK